MLLIMCLHATDQQQSVVRQWKYFPDEQPHVVESGQRSHGNQHWHQPEQGRKVRRKGRKEEERRVGKRRKGERGE